MANTSRKKTLPLAVLAAPALAFGSLTFAAAPAMAVPADEVEAIFAEEGIETILVYATEDAPVYRDGEVTGTYPAGSPLQIGNYDPETEQFVGYTEEERYDIADFRHGTVEEYLEADLDVPAFIEQLEDETDAPETVRPLVSLSTNEAQVGDTVRITIDNFEEVLASHNPDDYNLEVDGDVAEGDFIGRFGDAGIEQVGDEATYEFTIPETINTDEGEHEVGADSRFSFWVTFTMNPDAVWVETGSTPVVLDITANESPEEDEETPEGNEGETSEDGDENPDDADENANEGDQDAAPGGEEPVDPALIVESDEILVEDFVGNPEEGAGVVHHLTGMAPNTTFEYAVETPANIQPFSSSVLSDENGAAEFSIYGENADNPSVYLGDYTTTVTYEDEEGETQTLSVSFSVVEANDGTGDVDGDENDADVTPVVDTEEPAGTDAETDNDQDEAAPAPAVGGADAQLADTGANGTSLMWIAGGLLALGGAFVIYANRGRLFGRKN